MSPRVFVITLLFMVVACGGVVSRLVADGNQAQRAVGPAIPALPADTPPPPDGAFERESPELQRLDTRPRRATPSARKAVAALRKRFGSRLGVTYPGSTKLTAAARAAGVDTSALVIRRVHKRAFAVCEQRFERWSCYVHMASMPAAAKTGGISAELAHLLPDDDSPAPEAFPRHTTPTSGPTLASALELAREVAHVSLRVIPRLAAHATRRAR